MSSSDDPDAAAAWVTLPAGQGDDTPTLDALLSPPRTADPEGSRALPDTSLDEPHPRDSMAESDILDGDRHFSNIPLSATGSTGTFHSINSGDSVTVASPTRDRSPDALERTRRNTLALASSGSSTLAEESMHKRSASGSSVRSIRASMPFMLQRLDLEKVQSEGDRKSRPISLEGQHKLKEDFTRMQERQDKQDEAEQAASQAIDWDFWGAVISDYQAFALDNSDKLARAIEKGIPDTLRGMMWQLMSASKDPELESTYLRLLKESSTHEKAIIRDLGRTFPHHDFFTDGQGIGQENLFNVLKAYSLYDEQVGYCQGLPFLVAILLLNMPDEEAFCLLVRLMYSYDLRGHFLPEMPKLQLRLFQFDRLVEEMLPVLHVHFLRQGIKSSMYTSQWFLTLFSYRFPLEIVFRIYDNILANGVEAIFSFSLALLVSNEEALLKLKFDEILSFLNLKVFDTYEEKTVSSDDQPAPKVYKVDQFVTDATSLRVTPFMLDSYAREYDEMVRVRDEKAVEMDLLRSSNRSLSAQVKNLEGSLAQLNTEHVELLNELVRARLQNEETESELVRYKLLYAEAMHQNASDAMSGSTRISNAFSFMSGRSRGSSGGG